MLFPYEFPKQLVYLMDAGNGRLQVTRFNKFGDYLIRSHHKR